MCNDEIFFFLNKRTQTHKPTNYYIVFYLHFSFKYSE